MFIYLNTQQVIIDIVENFKPIKKNRNNIFIPCDFNDAQAIVGSNDAIYAKAGINIVPSFSDIFSVVSVDNVPENVEPLKWKYVDGEFVENTDPYPYDNITLTNTTEKNTADIEYIAIMSDIDI